MTDLSEILDGVRGSRCQIGANPVGSRISTHTGDTPPQRGWRFFVDYGNMRVAK